MQRPVKNGDKTARARLLLRDHEPKEVARILDMPKADIYRIAAHVPMSWVLLDYRTGRRWRKRTERSCYLHAQILGLTDYTFGRGQA